MKIYVSGITNLSARLKEYLQLSGFTVSSDSADFDYAISTYDQGSQGIKDLSDTIGKYYPDPTFINKTTLEQKCVSAGLDVLPSMAVSDLASCNYPYFIIKPKLSSGGKNPNPWAYKIFDNSQVASVIAMIGDTDTSEYFVQKALIDPATRETYLLFVDGVVNGQGQIHFNSISDKYMLDPVETDSFITHKVGIREVSSVDKFGFKSKITTLLQANNIRNTPFKAQAIVDVANNTCYINDWSWGIMPYTHLYVLDHTYIKSALEFAYDINPTVTKPIDKVIVMNHIQFPVSAYGMNEQEFDAKYKTISDSLGLVRVEQTRTYGSVAPSTNHFILYGTAVNNKETGTNNLVQFQDSVLELN